MFTATEFSTVQDKERFFAYYKRFVQEGCPIGLFTKKFYGHVSNLFGHIAHYDKTGFYETWCSTPEKCLTFLRYHLGNGGIGDPAFTWSDVECAITDWLKDEGSAIVIAIHKRVALEQKQVERAELIRLLAKYGVPK